MAIKQGLFFNKGTSKIELNLNGEHFNVDEATGEVTVIGGGGGGETDLTEVNTRLNALEDSVFPYSFSASGSANYRKGTSQTVNIAWSLKKAGAAVTPDSVTINGASVTAADGKKVYNNVTTDTSYAVVAKKGSKTWSETETVKFYYPVYYGVATSKPSAVDTNSISSKYGPSSVSISGKTGMQYPWIAVPSGLTLSSVKNQKNDELKQEFESAAVNVTDSATSTSVEYTLWRYKNNALMDGLTLTFNLG